ncbi:alpha-hydroxy-acid oxidizing protein [Rhodospirillaceae bacterium AH-315-P19]|nr:alpha-hydroxy-acid oxidizing protein [Rhodospirillaceae bacterium AH-315-P19]
MKKDSQNSRKKAINVAPPIATLREARERARSLVSPQAWDWLEGGTEREWTLDANTEAYRHYFLKQRILRDVTKIAMGRRFLGKQLPMPLIGAPLGGLTQYHQDGEIALVQGGHAASTIMTISAMSRLRIEEIREAAPKAAMIYQVYFQGPDSWLEDEVARAKAAQVKALCLCGDAPVRTLRYRDRESRYDARKFGRRTNASPPNHALGARATWDYIAWFKKKIDIPIIVKGIVCAEDATLALEHGADILWVSNHGGRVLDSGLASLDVLPEIRAAVGKKATIVFDGGIRTGSDVLKALALGADIVASGRPSVYGLAVDGADGVQRVFELFAEEFRTAMAMCGITRLDQIGPDILRLRPDTETLLSLLP